jgi:hypothetical protein
MVLKGEQIKPAEERHEIIIKALRIMNGLEDSTISDLAREYGISRPGIYTYLDYVVDDPEGRLRAAEEEVEFRREVLRLVGKKEAQPTVMDRFSLWG